MLDKLIDFILKTIRDALPFTIVFQYQNAVRLRFGKYKATLLPGIHFKIPYADTILAEQVVDTTMMLPSQSVRTLDGKQLVVRGVIGYKIENIEKFICNVWDTRSALADRTCAFIKETIAVSVFEACLGNSLDETLTYLVTENVKNYGIKVNFVSLIDITESKSLRLFNENGQVL